MKKGAVQLPINFLVILVISLVVFGFGVKMMGDIFSKSTEAKELTIDELDRRIESLLCDASDRICIGTEVKTLKRGEFGIFGLLILNVIGKQEFTVTVETVGYLSKGSNNLNQNPEPPLTVIPAKREALEIDNNQEKKVGIGIEVPKNAKSGTYIFNVIVEYKGNEYGKRKIYVKVP